MKREKILDTLREAAEKQQICNLWVVGDANYYNVWPLLVSDEVAVCAHDEDFLLNGYHAFAVGCIEKVAIKEDRCAEFSRLEGVTDQLTAPPVDAATWQTLFATLPAEGLIGVDRLNCPEGEAEFALGRIVKAGKKRLHLLYLDSEAVWEETPWKIRYEDITVVRFADRYLTVFGKYAGEGPHETPD